MREGSPAEASKGPLVVITAIRVLLLSLLCVLLVLVSSLGLGIFLVEGDGQLNLLLLAHHGEGGGVPGLVVGGQGRCQSGGGVHCGVVDGG